MQLALNVWCYTFRNLTFSELSLTTGTTKLKNLSSNIFSVRIKLTKDDLIEISDAVPASEVAGPRVYPSLECYSGRYANTLLQK